MIPGMGEGVFLGFKIFCWGVGVEAVPDRHVLRRHFDLVNLADRTLTLRLVFCCEEAKRDIGTQSGEEPDKADCTQQGR